METSPLICFPVICFPVNSRDRSSHLEVFCKKGVLRHFAKFLGKHLYQGLFNKVAGSGLQLYLKTDSGTGVFL